MRHFISGLLLIISTLALIGCSDQYSVAEGQKYGAGKDVNACNNRAMELLTECQVVVCDVVPSDFAKGCVMASSYHKDFCEQMPLDSAFDTVEWVKNECADHKDPQSCEKVLKYGASRCMAGDLSQPKQSTQPNEAPAQTDQTQQL